LSLYWPALQISKPKLELQSIEHELHDCPENEDGIQREVQALNKGDNLSILRELDTMSEFFIEFQVSPSLPLSVQLPKKIVHYIYNLELRDKRCMCENQHNISFTNHLR